MDSPQITLTIDACGLSCPLPLLKAKQGLTALNSGESLLLLATDPASQRDVVAFTELSPHTLLSQACEQGVYRYHILKS